MKWQSFYDRYQYPMNRANWFKKFDKSKKELQKEWKPRILLRDGDKCVVCGSENRLQLCHITSVFEFIQIYAKRNGKKLPGSNLKEIIRLSYRNDNLLTMCVRCHLAEHKNTPNHDLHERVKDLQKRVCRIRGWTRASFVIDSNIRDKELQLDEARPTRVLINAEYRPFNGVLKLKVHCSPPHLVFDSLNGWSEEEMKQQYPHILYVLAQLNETDWVLTKRKLTNHLKKRVKMSRKMNEHYTETDKEIKKISKDIDKQLNIIMKHGLHKFSDEELEELRRNNFNVR